MDFMLFQMDVKCVFLNGYMMEEVYVKQPPGFDGIDFSYHVYKLDKALYELKKSSIVWYDRFSSFLLEHQYIRGGIDDTFFISREESKLLIGKKKYIYIYIWMT